MRGRDDRVEGMFSYIRLEDRVPVDHPLRAIRVLTDEVLAALDSRFEGMYSLMGLPSIAPEMLLQATLLQAFFSVRSERQLMEQIDYNLLFRWFVGLPIDAAIWHPTVFSHNRDRLMAADVAREFLGALMGLAQVKALLSSEHFSVDGTLINAWASMKSFQPKDGSGPPQGPGRNGERDFHGQKRSNETHFSTTDPDARLYKKSDGQPSRLCYMGHVLMENRNGLAVEATLTHASGTAEREATLVMLDRKKRPNPITLGADKAYGRDRLRGRSAPPQCHPPYRRQRHRVQAGKGPQNRHRRGDNQPPRLCHQPALPQTHRGGLRLDQDRSGLRNRQSPRQTACRRHLHPRRRRLQSDPYPETAGKTRHLSQTPKDRPDPIKAPTDPETSRQIDRQNPDPEKTLTTSAAC